MPMAKHVYKEVKGEVVYRSVEGLNPKGWINDPAKLLEDRADGYEIREEGKLSSRRK
jgi:hypothetical protein